MKYKILSIICVLCLLAGCKVELPKDTGSALPSSVSSLMSSLPQNESSAAVSSVLNSQIVSAPSAVSSAAAPNSASPGTASKPSSANATASKAPAASKPSSTVVKEQSCTLLISCSDILKSKDKFSADQLSTVPADGSVYDKSGIPFEDGDTVFDVLVREMKASKIQMEFASSPVYQTTYIKGIDNIYEKAFGGNSGWIYAVNGKQPPVGCGSYKLKSGDKIQWLYVCGQ